MGEHVDSSDEIKQLLTEIRDNQRLALEQQKAQLDLACEQLARTRSQVSESIDLQKQAMQRFKSLSLVVLPVVFSCVVLIAYLIVRYF